MTQRSSLRLGSAVRRVGDDGRGVRLAEIMTRDRGEDGSWSLLPVCVSVTSGRSSMSSFAATRAQRADSPPGRVSGSAQTAVHLCTEPFAPCACGFLAIRFAVMPPHPANQRDSIPERPVGLAGITQPDSPAVTELGLNAPQPSRLQWSRESSILPSGCEGALRRSMDG
jgi:hypothetical protein